MMKQLRLILCCLLITACVLPSLGQRKMENLDRGIMAVPKSANQMFISWRHFASDPDDIAYNLYYKTSDSGPLVKLNSTPITNSTNYTATNLYAAMNSYTFVVKSVLNGEEKEEPGSFTVPRIMNGYYSRIVRDYDFEPFPVNYPQMHMKFCWPGDLNGDGRYDFVVDRQPTGGMEEGEDEVGEVDTSSPPIHAEAYKDDGTFMWRISMGYNVFLSSGHSDKLTVYDMDGDSKAEVLLIVSEGTKFPNGQIITGADGKVTDYNGKAGSAPHWLAIINGETGNLIDTISLPRQDEIATTRSDKWKNLTGHFVIAYLDGIHPFLVYQYKNRQADGSFTGAHAMFSYNNGKLKVEWSDLFFDAAQFHQVRVADVDGDGKDEFVEGGYILKHDGSAVIYKDVVHGDRHCIADIDPDRPGLEHFFIQQYNPSTVGMGLVDPATGELIKGVYAGAAGDVGRGICGAFDTSIRGMQFFSTMNDNAMYNSKGNLIQGAKGTFPAEALWFGADLSRRHITSTGSDKNPTLDGYNQTNNNFGREISLFHENNGHGSYYFRAPNGGRAAFWGDLFGDWREELIYARNNNTGFVIISTWDQTAHRQYCLMQNPAYRGQTTAKGYYQTADVDFYMAWDMPQPPVSPVQKADLYYAGGNNWINYDENASTYTDGKSIMFDIRGGNSSYTLNNDMAPSRLWLMNPKGSDYTFTGTGKFTGAMDIVKSLQGDVILNGNHDYTGVTRISEGRLFVNGTLAGKVRVDARGVIGGNATLNGGITMETGLNVEGGRIEPGMNGTPGALTIVGNLVLPGRNNLAFDVDQTQAVKNDSLHIQGDFNVTGTNNSIVIKPVTEITAGTLKLVTFTGTTNATPANFKVIGLDGIPYTLKIENNVMEIELREPRAAGNILWRGGENTYWDFYAKNFLNGTEEDSFVPGDMITFDDDANARRDVIINETMPVGGMIFNHSNYNYKITGGGSISGTGSLKKTGTGTLSLLNGNNSFTGGIDIEDGILEVSALRDGGVNSSIGAASADAGNWIMRNATLQTAGQMATNRDITVHGTMTVNNPSTSNSVLISGKIAGTNAELIVTGQGMLTLQGNNTISKVTVKEGLLFLGSVEANNISLKNTNITLEGGTFRLLDVTGFVSNQNSNFNLIVPEGATATFDPPSRWTLTGSLTGKGVLNFRIPNNSTPRLDLNGNWSAFEGVVNITGGLDFRINNNNGYGKATLNLASAINAYHLTSGRTVRIGGLSGVEGSKLGGSNTNWIVGGNNVSGLIFNGRIEGSNSRLNKEGTGVLTLTGANTYTGLTDVTNGTLLIANTTGSATGTNNVTVRTGAKFGGTGSMDGNLSIYANSYLLLQDSQCAALTVKGELTFAANSNMSIDIEPSTSSADIVNAGGKIAVAGNLEISKKGNSTFQEGMTFKIFNTTKGITGSFTQITTALDNGLAWDQSRLSEGIIKVSKSTALPGISADKVVKTVEYYNLTGVAVNEDTKGFIICRTIYTDGSVATDKVLN